MAFKHGRNFAIALAVFGVLAVLVLAATVWYDRYLAQQTQALVTNDLSRYQVTLRSALDTRLATLDGLSAFVAAQAPAGTTATPDAEAVLMANAINYAQGVAQNRRLGVQTMALQRPGAQWLIYPALAPSNPVMAALTSLQAVSSTNANASTNASANTSASSAEQIQLSAPFEVAPGQLALIAYKPILKNDAVWGTAAIVMDANQLLADSGVTVDDRVQQVVGLQDQRGQWLFGGTDPSATSSAIDPQNNPIQVPVAVPNGQWVLMGRPAATLIETNQFHVGLIRIIALVIAFLSSKLVLLALVRQSRLEAIVDDRVRELARVNDRLESDVAERTRAEQSLRESEAQNRALMSAIPDLMFRIDRNSRFIGYHVRNENDLYIPAHDFMGKRLDEVLPPNISAQFETAARDALATQSVQLIEYDLASPDQPNTLRHFESRICAVGPNETLSLVRDITERKLAYLLLEQRVAERTRELQTLLNVSEELTSTLELKPLIGLVLDYTAELLGYDLAAVLVPRGDKFVYLDYRGDNMPEDLHGTEAHPAVLFAVQEVIAERDAGYVDDLFGPDVLAQKFASRLPPHVLQHMAGLHAALGVPMEVKDRVIGVMLLMHREPGHYNEGHVKLATGIADLAAVAMENARLYERAQDMAVIEERQRLARDLHDAVTQTLFSASLIAEVLPKIWHRDPEETERRLEELRWFTRGALAEMRMLLLELRPTGLTNTTLGELLRQLADATTARTRFPILLQVQSNATLLPNVQVAFYRIAQEALNNIWKHASAGQVRVTLILTPFDASPMPYRMENGARSHMTSNNGGNGNGHGNSHGNGNGHFAHGQSNGSAHHGANSGANGSSNGNSTNGSNGSADLLMNLTAEPSASATPTRARHARLEVHDDGVGFHPDRVTASHLGLAIMRERAADIQAQLTIRSAPGQGTTIILDWHYPTANGSA